MKKILIIAVVLASLFMVSASADIVEGAWTGVGQALGKTASVSASFDGMGNFTAFGIGMSVAGSYTVFENSVTLEANNMSMAFTYSTDGMVETMTGSMTYMGVRGTITLERSVASAPVVDVAAQAAERVPVEDIFAAWKNTDRMYYSLSFYRSGFCEVSVGDTKKDDENLASAISEIQKSEAQTGITDVMAAIKNNPTHIYTFAGKFSVNRNLITIKLLQSGFAEAPESFLTASWDENENVLTLGSSDESGNMTVYNMVGKQLTLKAFPLEGDEPDGELFWRYSTVSKGESGDKVKLLQEKLIEKGFLQGNADGVFGGKTQAAIETLQEQHGMEKTGAANEKVWDILLG